MPQRARKAGAHDPHRVVSTWTLRAGGAGEVGREGKEEVSTPQSAREESTQRRACAFAAPFSVEAQVCLRCALSSACSSACLAPFLCSLLALLRTLSSPRFASRALRFAQFCAALSSPRCPRSRPSSSLLRRSKEDVHAVHGHRSPRWRCAPFHRPGRILPLLQSPDSAHARDSFSRGPLTATA